HGGQSPGVLRGGNPLCLPPLWGGEGESGNIELAFREGTLHPTWAQAVLRREVPLLCPDWGVRDEDALVHSLGMNFLAALGRQAGFVGLVEYPVPHAERWPGKIVRVDAAWIDAEERRPRLLGEFGRFTTEAD